MSKVFNTILIDDEPAARRIMKDLLKPWSAEVNIIDEASSGGEAIQKIDQLKPDLIFLDIQMNDYTGFEVVDQISFRPNIIFTTAYEQYALKAFETFSIDYLLKPVREDRLAQALNKLKEFGRLNQQIDNNHLNQLIQALKAPPKSTALTIRVGDRILLVRYENIVYFEAQDKYVLVYTSDGQKYLTDQSLTVLEEKLPEDFMRIQKSFIVNRNKIKELHRHFNGRYVFVLDDVQASRITSGRTFSDQIKQVFNL